VSDLSARLASSFGLPEKSSIQSALGGNGANGAGSYLDEFNAMRQVTTDRLLESVAFHSFRVSRRVNAMDI